MPELVAAVKEQTEDSCYVNRLRNAQCSVSLDGVPTERLIIDLDGLGSPLGPQSTRCDYLVFFDNYSSADFFVAVELKAGALDASEAVDQLQAGATCAESLVDGNHALEFRPVVFCGSRNKHQLTLLKKRKIRYHNKTECVRVGKCGQKLLRCFAQ